MDNLLKEIDISIEGMGIVVYSNGATKDIEEGFDYFTNCFSTPEQVANHIKKGDIVAFNLGAPGDYKLHIKKGYPNKDEVSLYTNAARLAINVVNQKVSFIDLYWLMEWSDEVPDDQSICLDDGVYHMTVLTKKPDSGVIGDGQDVIIYLKKINEMPVLSWDGVPLLF